MDVWEIPVNQPLQTLDPALWESHAVYRESFLCLRLSDLTAEAGRDLGRHFYRTALESFPVPLGPDALSLQRALMAHARDLRQQEGALRILGSAAGLSPKVQYRAQIARHVAASLARLATTLEAASR